MYCRKCGTSNADNAYKCTGCGEVLQSIAPKKIENNLVLAIIVTALCCLPFGVVGIVYAAQVNGKAQAGDIAGAEQCAQKARKWSQWGLGIAVVGYTLWGLVALVGAMAG